MVKCKQTLFIILLLQVHECNKHKDEALLSGVCKVKYDNPRCTAASPHVEKHDLLTLTHWRALGLRPGDWSTASIVPLLVLTGYWRLLAISVKLMAKGPFKIYLVTTGY